MNSFSLNGIYINYIPFRLWDENNGLQHLQRDDNCVWPTAIEHTPLKRFLFRCNLTRPAKLDLCLVQNYHS